MPVEQTRQPEVDPSGLLEREHALQGAVLYGLDGHAVEIHARALVARPEPISWRAAVSIRGMARGIVREALDRIATALTRLGMPQSNVEILIQLEPSHLLKEGPWLDLPLAIAMLQAAGLVPPLSEDLENKCTLIGEIAPTGEIRRMSGILALACTAGPGYTLIVPEGNQRESALIKAAAGHSGCTIYGAATLEQVIEYFQGKRTFDSAPTRGIEFEAMIPRSPDFFAVEGESRAKDAAVLAAAGGHNLLLVGPPSQTRTLLAQSMPGVLPRLTNEEKVALTRVYSGCGLIERDGVAATRRPVRVVDSTISTDSLIGRGSGIPKPGEITLAHLGVLFLDDLTAFNPAVLDALAAPLETGEISFSRGDHSLEFPSRFMLIATMSACPCNATDPKACRCDESQIRAHRGKISGLLLDCIDLQVRLNGGSSAGTDDPSKGRVSPRLRARVLSAREMQGKRFEHTEIANNASIPWAAVESCCDFSEAGLARYHETVKKRELGPRSAHRLAKVARTAADLAGSAKVDATHVDTSARFVAHDILNERVRA